MIPRREEQEVLLDTPSSMGESDFPKGTKVILYVRMEKLQRIFTHVNTSWIYSNKHVSGCPLDSFEQSSKLHL